MSYAVSDAEKVQPAVCDLLWTIKIMFTVSISMYLWIRVVLFQLITSNYALQCGYSYVIGLC